MKEHICPSAIKVSNSAIQLRRDFSCPLSRLCHIPVADERPDDYSHTIPHADVQLLVDKLHLIHHPTRPPGPGSRAAGRTYSFTPQVSRADCKTNLVIIGICFANCRHTYATYLYPGGSSTSNASGRSWDLSMHSEENICKDQDAKDGDGSLCVVLIADSLLHAAFKIPREISLSPSLGSIQRTANVAVKTASTLDFIFVRVPHGGSKQLFQLQGGVTPHHRVYPP